MASYVVSGDVVPRCQNKPSTLEKEDGRPKDAQAETKKTTVGRGGLLHEERYLIFS